MMRVVTLLYCTWLMCQGGNTQNRIEPTQELRVDPITLDDIFISVKTTHKYHGSRLLIILLTWFNLAKEQTWFFTDKDNKTFQLYTEGHLVNTRCQNTHLQRDLCCKMNAEYDHYLDSGKKWFCHFDDDNYVNVVRLLQMLQLYDHKQDWYLGRNSVPMPMAVRLPNIVNRTLVYNQHSFMFATGGAGFCISQNLAIKMAPYTRKGRFIHQCIMANAPDDVVIGYIIESLLKENLTIVSQLHSHLEDMRLLDPKSFHDQISFGYLLPWNVINITGGSFINDTTRFLSLHCFLFPKIADFCQNFTIVDLNYSRTDAHE